MKNLLLTIICCFGFLQVFSQESVQTFTYESTTRDTLISFPEGDHNRYERILMHYSMRCKDGLVSTGSERNKGCGEWDYSCNTYIVDSTRVDSIKASSPEFAMPGYAPDVFEYSTDPTYSFYQSTRKTVTIDDTFGEDHFAVATPAETLPSELGGSEKGLNLYYLLPAQWFVDNDIDRLTAASLPVVNATQISNLVINIAETEMASLTEALNSSELTWVNYLQNDVMLEAGESIVHFHEVFRWDDSSNVLVSLSFDSSSEPLITSGENTGNENVLVCQNANSNYMRFGTSGHLVLEDNLAEISDEITVSFWQRGADNLPTNSTIIEAVDNNNRRQINIHLPWGNSQVYWDCGNDGGGYDRINKTANLEDFRGKWNHWAFTKNASTGMMAIYLNGELWHSGSGQVKSIDAQAMKIAANFSNSLSYYGDMDELRIWSKELDEETIKNNMYNEIDASHPNYDDLVLYYNFNNTDNTGVIEDNSPNAKQSAIVGRPLQIPWRSRDLFIDALNTDLVPAHDLVDGLYLYSVEEETVTDSVPELPQRIDHYMLEGTDLVLDWTEYYYQAGDYPIFDEMGNEIGSVNYPAAGSFEKGELIYYSKTPMAYEIMSFVTPYGIGIDFGLEGLTWTFDVTDFGPILKGDKRLYMSRGGQWQEEMDIRFEFIEGTPDRDVIDIQQIWRVDQIAYGSIINDWRFEPRMFEYDPSVTSYVIQTAITGHGQQGEFIPRNHSIDVDGFIDTWSVWKECAENPVYPQGGTWVYDRAGWCPGMATDVRRYDVTPYFQFSQTPMVDYTVQTASGDSRYIVNSQLIKYGPPNKQHDIALDDLIYPSNRIEHGRFNPNCHAPKLVIQNKGGETVNSAMIYYGIRGKSEKVYNWTGVLPFLIKQEVTLPYDPALAQAEDGDVFFVRVELEGATDESAMNNEIETALRIPEHFANDVVIEWRTNFTPEETSYRVTDDAGELILFKSGTVLNDNTTYRDTLKGLNGCFKLRITDSDNDGISWWANNDGNGYIRVKEVGGSWIDVATDFGAFIDYNFTAGTISSYSDIELDNTLTLYPNPSSNEIQISGLEEWESDISFSVTTMQGVRVIDASVRKSEINNRPIAQLSDLPEGSYLLNITDGKRRSVLKFIRI